MIDVAINFDIRGIVVSSKLHIFLAFFLFVTLSPKNAFCDDAYVPSTKFVLEDCRSNLASNLNFNKSYCAAFISGVSGGINIGRKDIVEVLSSKDLEKLQNKVSEQCIGSKKDRLEQIALHFLDAVDSVQSKYDKDVILKQSASISLGGVLEGKFKGKKSICSK